MQGTVCLNLASLSARFWWWNARLLTSSDRSNHLHLTPKQYWRRANLWFLPSIPSFISVKPPHFWLQNASWGTWWTLYRRVVLLTCAWIQYWWMKLPPFREDSSFWKLKSSSQFCWKLHWTLWSHLCSLSIWSQWLLIWWIAISVQFTISIFLRKYWVESHSSSQKCQSAQVLQCCYQCNVKENRTQASKTHQIYTRSSILSGFH